MNTIASTRRPPLSTGLDARKTTSFVNQLTVITWLAMWLSRRRNYEENGATDRSPDCGKTRSGLLLTEATNS